MKRWHLVFIAMLTASLLVVSQSAEAQKSRKSKKLLGDGSGAAAQSGVAPQSQIVEPAYIQADPTLPTFTVTVESQFVVAAQGIVSGGGVIAEAPSQSTYTSSSFVGIWNHNPQSMSPSTSPDERLGYGAAAQLVTALMSVSNVVVIDYETYRANSAAYPEIFVIKGTVTEYTETNQLDQDRKGWSTVTGGVILNAIGNATGVRAVSEVGRVAAMAKGGKQTITTTRTGMVGLSLQIMKPSTGQIVGAPVAKGTFVTQSATQIKHGLGIQNSQAEYQASALDQAGQAALNDAITQIWSVLKRQATSQVAVALPAK